MSRYDKFRYIYANILNESLSDEQFETLCKNFAELVYKGVINSPFVDGAVDFLEKYHKKIPLYIVSATPETELIQIVKERGISGYIKRFYGAPKKKADCIEGRKAFTDNPSKNILFIGDAINDWKAAEKTGVRFIGRVKPGDPDIFKNITGI
ncbi:MAG: HAD family hydrolase [Methanomicrobiaceae archaeon]|nr:HAD family hydrolase [Methanomicrobiaceae archaeon]